jgi:hypothetical protein
MVTRWADMMDEEGEVAPALRTKLLFMKSIDIFQTITIV